MIDRETGDTPPEDAPAGSAERAATETPHLDESIRRIRAAATETLSSGLDSGRALRKLVSADFALARSATGRALAWAGVAVVFGASAWLLAMAAAIALLQAWGLSWLASIAITMLLSLVATGLAAWRVTVYFDHAGMHATRRQFIRLGLLSDSSDEDDDTGASPTTAQTGTSR